jgi:hypothetical protein
MSVWVCVPSKRPPAEVERWAQAWHAQGYKVALWRDGAPYIEGSDFLHVNGEYPGYAQATNFLINEVMRSGARWFVIGGDDVFPDTTKRADEIAQECFDHFDRSACERYQQGLGHGHFLPGLAGLFGVMQPTGDKWGDKQGPYIERVAGSAWIGREFALRAYGGNGPLWPEYFHMYPDEELQLVAQKLGVFWQRPDLTQLHQHWGRPKEGETMGHSHNMPEFLKRANSDKEWDAAKKLFEARKAAGFPGHEVKV